MFVFVTVESLGSVGSARRSRNNSYYSDIENMSDTGSQRGSQRGQRDVRGHRSGSNRNVGWSGDSPVENKYSSSNIRVCGDIGNRACEHWDNLLMDWKIPMTLIQHSVNSDWLFNTQSRVLQADWFILGINENATLNIHMPY